MFWILMSLLAAVAFVLARRRGHAPRDEEPWRASLDDDEPLDLDEIRQAEEEWLEHDGWEEDSDEDGWA